MTKPTIYDRADIARLCGVSHEAVRLWVISGRIKPDFYDLRGRPRFTEKNAYRIAAEYVARKSGTN